MQTVSLLSCSSQSRCLDNVLSHWIVVGCNAYDEYTYVPWLDRHVYRRTVDLSRVCLQ